MTSKTSDPDRPFSFPLGGNGPKALRVDSPADAAAGSDPGPGAAAVERPGRFLAFFRAIRSERRDRRRAPRHEAVEPEVWVGWRREDGFLAVPGRLVDISRGGARVVLPHRPPGNRPVWIYKGKTGGLGPVRAATVSLTPAPDGAFSVRFEFQSPCPTPLWEGVLGVRPRART